MFYSSEYLHSIQLAQKRVDVTNPTPAGLTRFWGEEILQVQGLR
jgi:hypothetical protein